MCDHKLPCHESYPLRSLEELLSWEPTEADQLASKTLEPLVQHQVKEGPKVLLCHDMKGGYLADKYLHGSDEHDAYRFFHWSQIDSFVYFSHYLVTIPPVPWITAGHRNGVPVLGTLITEGNEGFNVCQQLLGDKSLVYRVLDQLERLMKFFQFDGWLVNIENQVDHQHVPELLRFLTLLKQRCNQVQPRSLLIWYDSVVVDPTAVHPCSSSTDQNFTGQLRWQNEFNDLNRPFFDVCDGIYLNYAWNENHLRNSRQLAEQLHRTYDVYVGVDIFGRGCFGGGGLQTNQALARIAQHRLSVALFAPGWVHECLVRDDLGKFTQQEYQFWRNLQIPDRHFPCKLPIRTSFCQGFGLSFFRNGFLLRPGAWHNLHLQQLQPNHRCGTINVQNAFEGGGCLHMRRFEEPLMECSVRVQGRCFVTLTFKQVQECEETWLNTPGAQLPAQHYKGNQSPLADLHQMQKEQELIQFFGIDHTKSGFKQDNQGGEEEKDLKIHVDATNSVSVRFLRESEILANLTLHQHLKQLGVSVLPINGWSSRCFEIVQPQNWPFLVERVFIKPQSNQDIKNGLLIGLFTISCMDSGDDRQEEKVSVSDVVS